MATNLQSKRCNIVSGARGAEREFSFLFYFPISLFQITR